MSNAPGLTRLELPRVHVARMCRLQGDIRNISNYSQGEKGIQFFKALGLERLFYSDSLMAYASSPKHPFGENMDVN